MFTCRTSLPKASCKKEEVKEAKPKGIPLREQKNSTRGKPNGAQAKHLQN